MADQVFTLPAPPPEWVKEEEQQNTPSWKQRLGAVGSRVIGPAAGTTIGGLIGTAVLPGAGTAAGALIGGALGGGGGEAVAEKIEGRDHINPKQVAVQSAIGAVPGSWLVRSGKPLLGAAMGAGISTAGSAMSKAAEGQNPLEAKNWGLGDLLGAGIGGALGGAFSKIHGVINASEAEKAAGIPKAPPNAPKGSEILVPYENRQKPGLSVKVSGKPIPSHPDPSSIQPQTLESILLSRKGHWQPKDIEDAAILAESGSTSKGDFSTAGQIREAAAHAASTKNGHGIAARETLAKVAAANNVERQAAMLEGSGKFDEAMQLREQAVKEGRASITTANRVAKMRRELQANEDRMGQSIEDGLNRARSASPLPEARGAQALEQGMDKANTDARKGIVKDARDSARAEDQAGRLLSKERDDYEQLRKIQEATEEGLVPHDTITEHATTPAEDGGKVSLTRRWQKPAPPPEAEPTPPAPPPEPTAPKTVTDPSGQLYTTEKDAYQAVGTTPGAVGVVKSKVGKNRWQLVFEDGSIPKPPVKTKTTIANAPAVELAPPVTADAPATVPEATPPAPTPVEQGPASGVAVQTLEPPPAPTVKARKPRGIPTKAEAVSEFPPHPPPTRIPPLESDVAGDVAPEVGTELNAKGAGRAVASPPEGVALRNQGVVNTDVTQAPAETITDGVQQAQVPGKRKVNYSNKWDRAEFKGEKGQFVERDGVTYEKGRGNFAGHWYEMGPDGKWTGSSISDAQFNPPSKPVGQIAPKGKATPAQLPEVAPTAQLEAPKANPNTIKGVAQEELANIQKSDVENATAKGIKPELPGAEDVAAQIEADRTTPPKKGGLRTTKMKPEIPAVTPDYEVGVKGSVNGKVISDEVVGILEKELSEIQPEATYLHAKDAPPPAPRPKPMVIKVGDTTYKIPREKSNIEAAIKRFSSGAATEAMSGYSVKGAAKPKLGVPTAKKITPEGAQAQEFREQSNAAQQKAGKSDPAVGTKEWQTQQANKKALGLEPYDQVKDPNGEAGFANPKLAVHLASGAGGALGGAAMDKKHPLRGAALGLGAGLAGPAAIKYAATNLQPENMADIGQAVKEKFGQAIKLLPDYYRSNLLLHQINLPLNMWAGPWGSGVMGALEHAMNGDERGVEALRLLKNPMAFGKKWGEMIPAAGDAIEQAAGRAEAGMNNAVPEAARRYLEFPARGMTAGDMAIRDILEAAGFTVEEAKRMTLTNEPYTPIGRGLTALKKGAETEGGKKSILTDLALPFYRTAVNQAEQSAERIPVLGSIVQHIWKDNPDSADAQVAQQSLGGGVIGSSWAIGKFVPLGTQGERTMLKVLNNLGGQYGTLASTAYLAGAASRHGKDGGQAVLNAVKGGDFFPLPSAQPIAEMGTSAWQALHGKLDFPNSLIPGGGMARPNVPGSIPWIYQHFKAASQEESPEFVLPPFPEQ